MTTTVTPDTEVLAPADTGLQAPSETFPTPGVPARRTVLDRVLRDRNRRRHALLRGQGLAGLIMVGTVVFLGLLAPVLAPYSPTEQLPGAFLLGPRAGHLLGTDGVNRDIFSRLLFGIRTDLAIIFLAVPAGAVIGSLLGLVATTRRSADVIAQRSFDVILAFPAIILGIALSAIMGPGLLTVSLVIAIAEIPAFGRMVRTSVLSLREEPFVESAQVVGAPTWWILRKHIVPNALGPLTVQLALAMSTAVFIEGGMSFLGLGVRPPAPSLGSLIRDGMNHIYEAPFMTLGPLVVIVILVLGFLLIAQALAAGRRH